MNLLSLKAQELVIIRNIDVLNNLPKPNNIHNSGSLVTFSQAAFISLQSLPSFIEWSSLAPGKEKASAPLPRLKQRIVPLHQWALQVCVLTGGSLLNNWALAYDIPLSLHIVFRSSGILPS